MTSGLAAESAYAAFDHLASMVAVVGSEGECIFANAAFEQVLGLARRSVQRAIVFDWFVDPKQVRDTVAAVVNNQFSTSRFEAQLRRPGQAHGEHLPVHVIVSQIDANPHVVVELVEIEQQTRLEREERAFGLVQANKELIRNLAHEIKNPLGGIRGAAQLLEMELQSKSLSEYTRVIINEADRLQALVDRLLAPHRLPHVVGDVNIHEVCETGSRPHPRGVPARPEGATRLRRVDSGVSRRPRAAHSGRAQHRAERRARLGRANFDGRRVHHDEQPHCAPDHLGQAALPSGIGIAYPGQRARACRRPFCERIFFPLVTGREGGSGLGLTLAQTFVQQHHGTVECESEPGKTVFKILIPLP